jgi:hypothetical protein
MARRLQSSSQKELRRDIKGTVQRAEVRMSNKMKNHQDNLLLANCDSWTSMHCRHPRPESKQSLITSMVRRKSRRPESARNFR